MGIPSSNGKTDEKYYIIAGPEFGDLKGRILLIDQSLYGSKMSGARWNDFLSETLTQLSFFPSKAHPDIWIKDCGTHYEYFCVYVDAVIFIAKDPMKYIRIIEYDYQVKAIGVPEFYMGGNMEFGKDREMVLVYKYLHQECH